MRLKLNSAIRRGLIFGVAVFLGILSLLLWGLINPQYREHEIPSYIYGSKSGVQYGVNLKPNVLSDQQSIGEGRVYIKEFIDTVKTTFSFEFAGDQPADIKGDYEILVSVEGFTGDKDEPEIIWKKDFPVTPRTSFQSREKAVILTREVSLKLQEYDRFLQRFIESSRINSEVRVSLIMNISMEAASEKGSVRLKSAPAIVFPLGREYFQIQKKEEKEKIGAIKETKQIQVPIDKRRVSTCSIWAGILLASLLYLAFGTSGVTADPVVKERNRIFRRYGKRIVAVKMEVNEYIDRCCIVRTMEDLIGISNKSGKPVIYQYRLNLNNTTRFYVLDDKWTYVFDLRETGFGAVLEKKAGKTETIEWGRALLPVK